MSPLFGQYALQSFFVDWPSPYIDAFPLEQEVQVDGKS